jgi:signal transduction histidine kinase/ligand-binding sensor domain-containing protein
MTYSTVERSATFLRALSLILLILTFAAPSLHAQGDDDLRRLTLSTWTTEQGLPQNFITAIDQTADGFLWIGTKGGLARFDGLNFKTSFANEPSAIHSGVNDVAHDATGRIWVTTNLGLLCDIDGHWSQITLPGKSSAQAGQLVVSRDGSLLVGIDGGIWRLNSSTLRFTQVQGTAEKIRSFAEDHDGNLWFTDGEAVTTIDVNGKSTRYPRPDASLIVAAKDGQVYVGDGHHLFRFDGKMFVRLDNPGTEEFVDMTIAHDGSLWMAAGGLEGLSRKNSLGVQRFGLQEGLASNDVRTLFEDRDGAMWIGTISGLQRLRRGAFASYSQLDGLPPRTAQYDAIFEAVDKSIWTGTLEDGVSVFRKGKWTTFGINAGVRRGQVRGFIEDGPMPMIAIADYGIFRWNGKRYAKVPGIAEGYITSPLMAEDGSIWFGIVRGGVYRMRGKNIEHFDEKSGLVDQRVLCLLPDHEGGLWAGANSGLFHFAKGRWRREYPELHDPVFTLSYGSSGELLLGTSAAVIAIANNATKTLSRKQGLFGDPVLQVVEDDEKSWWVVSTAGLTRISRPQLDLLFSGASASLSPELFTERDGLAGRDFLPANHALGLKASDGRLWFATAHGPSSGNNLPEAAPKALRDEITMDGSTLLDNDVRVPPGRHRLTFSFTAASFDAPELIRFRYRLVGWDRAWIDAGRLREASYAGLPPGRYSFEVQAIGRGDNMGPITRIPNVELLPFFWQTRWFVFLASLCMIAIVVEATRRRTMLRARRMNLLFQERAAERERIAYQIHDTVIQDLIGATLYLEIAEMELAAGVLDPSKPLEGLAARLRESIARSRSMVSNLHSTALPEYGLLDVLRLAEAEFRLAAEPAFEVIYTGEPRDVDLLLRDEVYRICREAIANAFRHASAKNIRIRVKFEPRSLEIETADNGVGMDNMLQQGRRAGHFGLPAMRAHAERIGATLNIDSALGKGTTVSLITRSSWRNRLWSSMCSRLHESMRRLIAHVRPERKTL